MTKEINKKSTNKRQVKYEPKIKFKGTFEQLIAISTTGAGVKKTKQKNG